MSPALPIHNIKADFFAVLGHPARVRILELLRDGDKTVGELQTALEFDSSSTSQHLAALRRRGFVESRKERTAVRYSVHDPRVFQLLEIARQMISANLAETVALLEELSVAEPLVPGAAGESRSR
jgi:DNA-binding transcriptional ArsR family regulator